MPVTPPPLVVVRALGCLLLGSGAGLTLVALFDARRGAVRIAARRYLGELTRELGFVRWPVRPSQVALGQVGVLAFACSLAFARQYVAGSLFTLAALAVRPWLHVRCLARTSAVEAQLDGFLHGLAATLRATPALGEAIEHCATLVEAPLRDELDVAIKEQRLGASLDEALTRMGARIGSGSVSSAFATLRIARRTGGDVSLVLERAAATLREMARLEGVVRTKTAEGKAQAFVLAVLPLPLVALLHVINPGFLAPLVSGPRGYAVITAAVVLWALALVSARKILDVDI